MNPNDLTLEQRKDIESRVSQAKIMLENLKLKPTASVQSVNVGDDIFSQKVVVYLQDQKYFSPISKKDL